MILPDEFVRYTRPLMGEGRWQRFIGSFDEEVPVSIRLNPFKRPQHINCRGAGDHNAEGGRPQGYAPTVIAPVAEALSTFNFQLSTFSGVPWCRDAYYLSERPVFTADPLFHAGTYYVQEASSMFLDHVLRQYVTDPVVMLDLCAAPGGKSTLARAALPEGSMLISNEPIRRRANILSENMQKWGHPDVIVSNNYPIDFGRSGWQFDVILADVPCSGEGMFRKDSEAVAQWSVAEVMKCSALQRSIIADVWDCLRPGGLLIYSTCTFNTKENEENVRFIADNLGADILPIDTDEGWGITGSLLPDFSAPVYRFIPGISRGEGLFMAVLRKGGTVGAHPCGRPLIADAKHRRGVYPIGGRPQGYAPTMLAPILSLSGVRTAIGSSLRVMFSGTEIDGHRNKDAVPSQALAMSITTAKDVYPTAEVSYDQAMAYLHREAITLSKDTPKGFVLLTYAGQPLGFVKNIGNRANNLYPSEWRIRNRNI